MTVVVAQFGPPRSILFVGRRWFQRGPGNTYHSVDIYVNGKCVHRIPFAYGYGQMYEQNGVEWLQQNGYLPGLKSYKSGGFQPLWQYAQDNGIDYASTVTDVARKRDL